MYALSTIIIVIHKVFYEQENGQTKGSEGQTARDSDSGAGFARGKQADSGRNQTSIGKRLGMGQKDPPDSRKERLRMKLDAASLGLAIRDCKERGFDRLTYAPTDLTLHAFLNFQRIIFSTDEI
jgi:hypothetical protein